MSASLFIKVSLLEEEGENQTPGLGCRGVGGHTRGWMYPLSPSTLPSLINLNLSFAEMHPP